MREGASAKAQIASALHHSRARPQPREGKGVGIIASTDRTRPALRMPGCPIQPTQLTRRRKISSI